METPTPFEIKKVIDNGGTFEDIDELFYPGERRRYHELKAEYPIPEGTGRKNPSSYDVEITGGFQHSDYRINGVWIGYIHNHYVGSRGRGGCFRTHDGKEFAHYGGPTGAEKYLIERYWLYGNPPEKNTILGTLKGEGVNVGKTVEGYMDDIEMWWSGLNPNDKWLVTVVIMILIVIIVIPIMFPLD